MSSKKAFLIRLSTLAQDLTNNFSKDKISITYSDPVTKEQFIFKNKNHNKETIKLLNSKKPLKNYYTRTELPLNELFPCTSFYQDQINWDEITGFNIKLTYYYNPYSTKNNHYTHIENWINNKCETIYKNKIKENKIRPGENLEIVFMFCAFKKFILTFDSISSIIQYNQDKTKEHKKENLLCYSSIDLLKIMKYNPYSLQENITSIENVA